MKAQFILDEARKLGIAVGTNGEEVVFITPKGLPLEVQMSFSRRSRRTATK
jgi:hypothetical protein